MKSLSGAENIGYIQHCQLESSMMTERALSLDYSDMEYSKKELLGMMESVCAAKKWSRRRYAEETGIKYQHINDWLRPGKDFKINYSDSVKIIAAFQQMEKNGAPLVMEPQGWDKAENAIADLLAGIFQMLINDRPVDARDVEEYLSFLSGHYAKWSAHADLRMIGLVRDALRGVKDETPARRLQHILSQRPAGSA